MKDIIGNKLKKNDEIWYLTLPEKGFVAKGLITDIIKYDIGGYKHENVLVDGILRGPLEVVLASDTKRAEPYLQRFFKQIT